MRPHTGLHRWHWRQRSGEYFCMRLSAEAWFDLAEAATPRSQPQSRPSISSARVPADWFSTQIIDTGCITAAIASALPAAWPQHLVSQLLPRPFLGHVSTFMRQPAWHLCHLFTATAGIIDLGIIILKGFRHSHQDLKWMSEQIVRGLLWQYRDCSHCRGQTVTQNRQSHHTAQQRIYGYEWQQQIEQCRFTAACAFVQSRYVTGLLWCRFLRHMLLLTTALLDVLSPRFVSTACTRRNEWEWGQRRTDNISWNQWIPVNNEEWIIHTSENSHLWMLHRYIYWCCSQYLQPREARGI